MSRKLVEDIHFSSLINAKKFKAYDIIDTGKTISILRADGKKELTTWFVFNKKPKEKIRELLKEIEKCRI